MLYIVLCYIIEIFTIPLDSFMSYLRQKILCKKTDNYFLQNSCLFSYCALYGLSDFLDSLHVFMIFHLGNYKENPLLFFFQRKSEIPDSIIIGYPFYNTLQRFFIIGIFPVLHPAADELTQNPAEIFMPGIR